MTRKKTAEYIYSGKPCKFGHIGARYKNGNCVECLLQRESAKQKDPAFAEAKRDREMSRYMEDADASRAKQRDRRELIKDEINQSRRDEYRDNSEFRGKVIASVRKYRVENPDAVRVSQFGYHQRNRVIRNERSKEYKKNNHARLIIIGRECSKRHYLNNKEHYWLKKQIRRAVAKQATPGWANVDAMVKIKHEAKRLTEELGVQYSVDHSIPLVGKNRNNEHVVCGLNCEGNMKVMLLSENKLKGCFQWENMP